MKKIKEKLIHLLGGVTNEEHTKMIRSKYFAGKSTAYLEMLSEMWGNYGKPADDWCKIIYDFAEKQYCHNNDKTIGH